MDGLFFILDMRVFNWKALDIVVYCSFAELDDVTENTESESVNVIKQKRKIFKVRPVSPSCDLSFIFLTIANTSVIY